MTEPEFEPCPNRECDGHLLGTWRELDGKRTHVLRCRLCDYFEPITQRQNRSKEIIAEIRASLEASKKRAKEHKTQRPLPPRTDLQPTKEPTP